MNNMLDTKLLDWYNTLNEYNIINNLTEAKPNEISKILGFIKDFHPHDGSTRSQSPFISRGHSQSNWRGNISINFVDTHDNEIILVASYTKGEQKKSYDVYSDFLKQLKLKSDSEHITVKTTFRLSITKKNYSVIHLMTSIDRYFLREQGSGNCLKEVYEPFIERAKIRKKFQEDRLKAEESDLETVVETTNIN